MFLRFGYSITFGWMIIPSQKKKIIPVPCKYEACAQEKTLQSAAPYTITKKHAHIRLLNTEKNSMHTVFILEPCIHGLVIGHVCMTWFPFVRVRGQEAGWTCLKARSTIGPNQRCPRFVHGTRGNHPSHVCMALQWLWYACNFFPQHPSPCLHPFFFIFNPF